MKGVSCNPIFFKMDNKEVILKIESYAFEGKGVARFEGKVYFVNGAVPGDVVRCVVKKSKKNYSESDIIQILEPSIHRILPMCKYFGTCGGCNMQQINYSKQLEIKTKIVEDALIRIGGISDPNILPIIGSEKKYFYRNKLEFTFTPERWLTNDEISSCKEIKKSFGLGFHIPNRFEKVLDIEECWLQSEISNTILKLTRKFVQEKNLSIYSTKSHTGLLRHLVIRQSHYSSEVMVNLITSASDEYMMKSYTEYLLENVPEITTVVNNITTRKSMVATGEKELVYYGNGYIIERLGNYLFKISPNSFFQTNTLQAEKLYNIVKTEGNLSKNDIVYDLYSGTGSIAIFISDAVNKVIGIELNETAVNDAYKNVELNNIANCVFLQGDLKDILMSKDFENSKINPDLVIVDPPRGGMHPKVLETITSLLPNRLIYLSCNPVNLARDLNQLIKYNYQLMYVQPVDMFPQTYHVETVSFLEYIG